MNVLTLSVVVLLAGGQINPVTEPPPVPAPQPAPEAIPDQTSTPAPAPGQAINARPGRTGAEAGAIVVTGRPRSPGDPLEKMNAQSYALTRDADEAVFRPVAIGYKNAVPKPLRRGLHNILTNLREPVVFLNYLLQLKPGKAAETVGRFTLNSSIGVAGLFDIAKRKPFGLPFRPNGFANTLGYYGVKQGAFLYIPFVGPTTVRDFIGDNLDRIVLPLAIGYPFDNIIYGGPGTFISVLDRRVEFDDRLTRLRETSDPYTASRDFYLERRQAEIDELHGRHHPLVLPENAPRESDPPAAAPLHDTSPQGSPGGTGVEPAATAADDIAAPKIAIDRTIFDESHSVPAGTNSGAPG